METKELAKKLEEMGLELEGAGRKYVDIRDGEKTVASIITDKMYHIDTGWYDFQELNDEPKEKLFQLLVEYASTPLDERDGKLYRLRLKRVPLGHSEKRIYLNYDRELEMFVVYYAIETDRWKTTFTKRQIKTMDEDYEILKDYEMIEVE